MMNMFNVQKAPPSTLKINIVGEMLWTYYAFCAMYLILYFPGQAAIPKDRNDIWFGALLGFFLAIFSCFHMYSKRTLELYRTVSQADCAGVLAACEATPEGRLYRDAVLAQGRELVQGEYVALYQWAASAPAREACRRLYRA